jgi:hypothetical protein
MVGSLRGGVLRDGGKILTLPRRLLGMGLVEYGQQVMGGMVSAYLFLCQCRWLSGGC